MCKKIGASGLRAELIGENALDHERLWNKMSALRGNRLVQIADALNSAPLSCATAKSTFRLQVYRELLLRAPRGRHPGNGWDRHGAVGPQGKVPFNAAVPSPGNT